MISCCMQPACWASQHTMYHRTQARAAAIRSACNVPHTATTQPPAHSADAAHHRPTFAKPIQRHPNNRGVPEQAPCLLPAAASAPMQHAVIGSCPQSHVMQQPLWRTSTRVPCMPRVHAWPGKCTRIMCAHAFMTSPLLGRSRGLAAKHSPTSVSRSGGASALGGGSGGVLWASATCSHTTRAGGAAGQHVPQGAQRALHAADICVWQRQPMRGALAAAAPGADGSRCGRGAPG